MRTRRSPSAKPKALVAILAALLCVACQNDGTGGDAQEPIAPSHEPIEFPNPLKKSDAIGVDERPLTDAEAGWKEKWELARRYAAAGYDTEALQIIDAALSQQPTDPWGTRLRALRTSLRMRKTEQELVRAEVRPDRDYVLFGRRVDLVIRIHNVSPDPIVLLPPQAEATGRAATSPSAVVLELERKDRDVSATELGRKWTQTLYLQGADGAPVRIPPGGVHVQPARIPPSDVGPAISGFRSLEIGGTFRAPRLQVGDTQRSVRVPLRGTRVAVLPRGYEPLAEDPLGSLAQAVDTVAPVHLLVATEFVPSGQRVEAVGILARALGEGHESLRRPAHGALRLIRDRSVGRPVGPLAQPLMDALARWPSRKQAIMEGLRAVTGVDVPPDVRLWHDWWRRATSARTSVASGTD
ncbi:MAG: hypothetical protein QNJ98_10020 [Planctomycetota bacterium]|nr:hypothetical protein [Planctomycetota bacterium]